MNPLISHEANGYDWKQANLVQKAEYCTLQSEEFAKTDKYAQTFLIELDGFFKGEQEGTLKITLSSAVALILVGLSARFGHAQEPPDKQD